MNKVLIIAAISVTSSLFAQVEFGFSSGVNYSTQHASYNKSTRISFSNSSDFSVSPVSGFNAGVLILANLRDRLDLKFTALYSVKGQYEKTTRTSGSAPAGGGVEFKDKIKYIDLPVELVYNLGQKQHHGMFVSFGIYLAKTLAAKSHFHDYDSDYDQECDVVIKSSIDNWKPNTLYIRPIDLGLRAGIGYRYRSFIIAISNEYALMNNIPQVSNTAANPLAEYSNKSSRRNVCWGLSVSYLPLVLLKDDPKK
jgi:hypothetical protein